MLDRFLRLFSDVRDGEGGTVVLLALNLFLVLVSYYVIKTVREPLILVSGGAEMKSYAAAAQAGVLVLLVPLYSWFAAKVDRLKLIVGVTLFFAVCIQGFYAGAKAEMPGLGFVFYVWVGIFSVAIIAQFWSYANDLYTREAGERLFPIVAIGATVGSTGGSALAGYLFDVGVQAFELMQVAAGLLLSTLALYWLVNRRIAAAPGQDASAGKKLESGDGFALVLRSPYLRLIAGLLILLNLVNTTGEYILSSAVLEQARAAAAADPTVEVEAFVGAFYGRFFTIVNIGTVVIQALIVSRIVKYLGIAGVVFALPVISLGAYGLVAAGAGFAVLRWAKAAENMTDYSVMNTAKGMLWLPTTREEKYKAKQAVDTFFVRLGDMLAAGLVFLGTSVLGFGIREFALVNVVVVLAWAGVGWFVVRNYRRLAAERAEEAAA